jgi:1-acylglycerone phosphate reductase
MTEKRQRSVLITGCSDGGLGAALALAFHNAGLKVYATARNTSKTKGLQAAGITTLALDVLSDSSIAACVAQIPSLDILVNNAGGMYSMPASDISIPEAKKLFDLNVWSYIAVSQAFLPLLIKSKGVIVNQTSVLSVFTTPFASTYNASKAATAMFTDTMRLELEPFGIRVVDLKTGIVTSNLFQNAETATEVKLPPGSIYTPFKDIVEPKLAGEGVESEGMKADDWARQVVQKLLKPKPSSWIWKGAKSTAVWISTFLPFGTMDGYIRKTSGLDKILARI